MMKYNYRPEIDGLRGIAVILVILYHSQFTISGDVLFVGGYLGVDIFFVISGYLITRIIILQLLETSSFSFLNFYERRARRILPMLYVIIIFSIPFAWQNLTPNEIIEFAESGLASMFFTSNFYFYNITTQYGAESSLLKPLLHTWSLGIEEQFYLIFPLLFVLIYKKYRVYSFYAIIALFFLSLISSLLIVTRNPELNFFLPISRFWELSAGGFLAYWEIYYKKNTNFYMKNILPTIGLILILTSFMFFSKNTPHPSILTIIPILGVVIIISFASKGDFIGKVLGFRPLVWVGLISYSMYLWHYPIFAFSRLVNLELSNKDKFLLLIVTILLSITSYFLIEKPMRKSFSRKTFYTIITTMTFILISILSFLSFAEDLEKYWLKYSNIKTKSSYLIIRDTQGNNRLIVDRCRINVVEDVSINRFKNEKYEVITDYAFNLKNRISECRLKYGKAIFILGDSHGSNIFNAFSHSKKYPFIIGSTNGGCRPHHCRKNQPNHYDFFKKTLVKLINKNDIIVFHQSGSYLIKDRKGHNDTNRAFNENLYKYDYANINSVNKYLSSIAKLSKAKLFWLGPFTEYRLNPKNIIYLSKKGRSYKKYLKINKNSSDVFLNLDLYLKSIDHAGYKFIPFSSFYDMPEDAIIKDSEGKPCFQFRNADHFSSCGEKIIGEKGDFSMFNSDMIY